MQFRFSLEVLLEHKRRLEDVARKNYLEAQALADQAKAELHALYQQVADSRLRAGQLERQGGQMATELSQIDLFINGQKIRITRQQDRMRELYSIAEIRNEELVEAAKERKTLERLKEKRSDAHRLAKKKHELKETDELVVTRFKGTGSV